MPQRALNIVLAVFGLCAVAALALAGADAWAHSRRGPWWWRRTVGAGLALMTLLGLGSCAREAESFAPEFPGLSDLTKRLPAIERLAAAEKAAPDPDRRRALLDAINEDLRSRRPRTMSDEDLRGLWERNFREPDVRHRKLIRLKADLIASSGVALEATDCWQRMVDVWREAAEIGSGRRGRFPVDASGKARLLGRLREAADDLLVLRLAGLLDCYEAELLNGELLKLADEVRHVGVVDLKGTMCYMTLGPDVLGRSATALRKRLDTLMTIAGRRVLRPVVFARALDGVACDIDLLANADLWHDREKEKALHELARRARAAVEAFAAGVGDADPPLEAMDEWQLVESAFRHALSLVETGRSTRAQRSRAEREVADARVAAVRLYLHGKLSWHGLGALREAAEGLLYTIALGPPVDEREEAPEDWRNDGHRPLAGLWKVSQHLEAAGGPTATPRAFRGLLLDATDAQVKRLEEHGYRRDIYGVMMEKATAMAERLRSNLEPAGHAR
ncbi:MAG: hypothetical protein ACYTKD_22355 [Planctomycetota bacterium]|jgi:hypothetical protein